ncbi:hypothetical protein ACFY0A_32405 [Streptomyces sp. NPDC001698]|uniref:hypothetical protein n=1 Tax=Streptomyces sp. NPDC001698 TaxID=3364601 RepID=UPI0036CC2424
MDANLTIMSLAIMSLTIVIICLGVLAVACYAIRRLSSAPARIVAVIVALATLVGALTPLVALLSEQRTPLQTVAPSMPATASVPATPSITEHSADTSPLSAATPSASIL